MTTQADIVKIRNKIVKFRSTFLASVDRTADLALEEAELKWGNLSNQIGRKFDLHEKIELERLVRTFTQRQSKQFYRTGTEHALRELKLISREAWNIGSKRSLDFSRDLIIAQDAKEIADDVEAKTLRHDDKEGTVFGMFYHFKRVVLSESFIAFEQAHKDVEAELAKAKATDTFSVSGFNLDELVRDDDSLAGIGIVKSWDAQLDTATCKTCRGNDGDFTFIGFPYPNGTIPAHPNCRCVSGYWPFLIATSPEEKSRIYENI